ncbi:uncharacterized protein LOC128709178 [Anopheles marshallii]|uniref:uncharacterized protein LOC128709178 n=1 Tax=Anopheles marshallii TaxID=1521116 RepID=UPI00237A31BB|nr:uncharacterized protein LOC128709178 [Anopheles marshallii]
MAVSELLWNCFLLMLFLGLLKAALSFYWPSIGEWRYDDLHPSLQYHESCRVKQLAVNGVFFIVYPCVLCYRCYASIRWTLWTECSETEDFAQYVEYSREEQELLRDGMIRGRMIVQREIVLTAAREDELSCYRKYDDCVVAVEKEPLEERTNPSECEPLNLSKDGEGLNNEEMLLLEHPREDATKRNTTVSSSEEEGDGDEISLIPQPSKACDASSFAQTGANR